MEEEKKRTGRLIWRWEKKMERGRKEGSEMGAERRRHERGGDVKLNRSRGGEGDGGKERGHGGKDAER